MNINQPGNFANVSDVSLSQAERLALAAALLTGGFEAAPGSFSGGTSGGSSSGGSGSSSSGPVTTGTPLEIQLLLSAIPIVEDGQVIRSEHHNLLRAALVAIAARLGVAVGGPTGPTERTLTIVPVFKPGIFSEWRVGFALAFVAQNASTTQGWLQVDLPDGALIKSMTLYGRRDGEVATFGVTLERQDIVAGRFDNILTIDLKNSAQIYNVSANFQGTPGLNEVDNVKYKYLIDAIVTRSQAAIDSIQIYAIQIVYTV